MVLRGVMWRRTRGRINPGFSACVMERVIGWPPSRAEHWRDVGMGKKTESVSDKLNAWPVGMNEVLLPLTITLR